jgi:DNA repair protein RecO (recombination protein O)
MNQFTVTGMILSTSPIKEYDRRMVILTKEQGKITAFANGARKPKSPLVGLVNPFSFGEFTLYEGRSSYTLKSAKINDYFENLREDLEGTYYGFYFLEVVDYFAKEGNDDREVLKLLYITLKALTNDKISNPLIRCIFELKMLAINGMAPEVFVCFKCGDKEKEKVFSIDTGGLICKDCINIVQRQIETTSFDGRVIEKGIHLHPSTLYAMQFIISSKLERLYTFGLSDEVLTELQSVMRNIYWVYVDTNFKSLEILNTVVAPSTAFSK